MFEKIELYAGKLASQRHLVALRNGIVLGMFGYYWFFILNFRKFTF